MLLILRKQDAAGNVEEERQTLHVMDDQRRIAMVETLTVTGGSTVGSPTPRFRYQLDDHLGTAGLEVDEGGAVISYEEFHPYGTTAWWAESGAIQVSAKRYRYTGKERDEETGLQYHSARYLMCWLGRWERADPASTIDGPNRNTYVRNSPTNLTDPSGNADPVTTAEAIRAVQAARAAQATSAMTAGSGTLASGSGGAGVGQLSARSAQTIYTYRRAHIAAQAALQAERAAFLATQAEGTALASAGGLSATGLTVAGGVGVVGGVVGYGALVKVDEAFELPVLEGTFTNSATGWSLLWAHTAEHGMASGLQVLGAAVGLAEMPNTTIQGPWTDESGLYREYLRDIESQTGLAVHPSQFPHLKEALRTTEFTRLSSKEGKKHRRKFNRIKDDLIQEWETNTDQTWPRYATDLYNDDGVLLRPTGMLVEIDETTGLPESLDCTFEEFVRGAIE